MAAKAVTPSWKRAALGSKRDRKAASGEGELVRNGFSRPRSKPISISPPFPNQRKRSENSTSSTRSQTSGRNQAHQEKRRLVREPARVHPPRPVASHPQTRPTLERNTCFKGEQRWIRISQFRFLRERGERRRNEPQQRSATNERASSTFNPLDASLSLPPSSFPLPFLTLPSTITGIINHA